MKVFLKSLVLYLLLLLIPSFVLIAFFYLLSDDSHKPINVHKTPYVALYNKNCNSLCSGFFFNYKGCTYIMTANHLFLKRGIVESYEYSPVYTYNTHGNYIGVSFPIIYSKEYDIAVLSTSKEVYDYSNYSYELGIYTKEELEEIVGSDVYYIGSSDLGNWYKLNWRFLPFVERTYVSRVVSSPVMEFSYEDGVYPVLIFVKGGVWYGCSGGPLVYKGRAIGVCSMLENHTPKSGAAYISVREFVVKYLDPIVNREIHN